MQIAKDGKNVEKMVKNGWVMPIYSILCVINTISSVPFRQKARKQAILSNFLEKIKFNSKNSGLNSSLKVAIYRS